MWALLGYEILCISDGLLFVFVVDHFVDLCLVVVWPW